VKPSKFLPAKISSLKVIVILIVILEVFHVAKDSGRFA